MTTASPWTPEPGSPAAALHAVEPTYRALLMTLCLLSRENADLPSLGAVVAVTERLGDLIAGTGILWQKPDLVAALHDLADGLERRREAEPARDLPCVSFSPAPGRRTRTNNRDRPSSDGGAPPEPRAWRHAARGAFSLSTAADARLPRAAGRSS
jgi:hypothetical protein